MTHKDFLYFIVKLVGFTALLWAIHWYVFFNLFPELLLYLPLWSIYLFNAAMVFIVYSIIYYKVSHGSDKAYTIFLSLTLVKMVLAIVFLLPLFLGKVEHVQHEVFNFFIPYFLYLIFEIYALNNFFKNEETK